MKEKTHNVTKADMLLRAAAIDIQYLLGSFKKLDIQYRGPDSYATTMDSDALHEINQRRSSAKLSLERIRQYFDEFSNGATAKVLSLNDRRLRLLDEDLANTISEGKLHGHVEPG